MGRGSGGVFAALACLLAGMLLGACQSAVVQEFPLAKFKAEKMLDAGIREYDNGNYKVAARTIQGALDAGLTTRSQGRAHKYLAFMHCIAGQQNQCRDEFRKGLEADRRLELSAAESGHPIWAPVFHSAKSGMPKP
ncbi:MAG TPA: TssQ family T6SS-associated lipoprotein [Burkholderiales bacterium]|nr:TssQ family T6SS-associated lipoprotein [Burkholderiales bacterium]